ncbi:hypothetical protein FRC01_007823 [Tulasnella sp. 417]|nr:hypothetical protein FRC01_007823 [Tulasnella sp. 417]
MFSMGTVPSQYPPETPVAETPATESAPPIDSPTQPPYPSTYAETYQTYDQTAPSSPEDERPRIVITRADSGYPETAAGEEEEHEPSPTSPELNRDTTYTGQLSNRDTSYSAQMPNRDTTFTAQVPDRDTTFSAQMPNHDTTFTAQVPNRDTTFSAQTGMTDGMRAPSEIATTGDLTRNNTQMSRVQGVVSRSNSGDSGTPEQSPTSDTKVSHHSEEKGSKRSSPASARQSRRKSRPLRHQRIVMSKRYSKKPFGYFHRYPRGSSALDPKNLTRASMRKARAAQGRSRASTSSSRTYISSRIGRIRRLFRDLVNLPWRGDSDYYGGVRGITAVHHFRGGAHRGGVSIRPKRDSKIPRAPWYRPKRSSLRMDLPRNPGQVQGWQGLRTGLNSPLTDGSDRATLDRFGNLPASASPFVSPYQMRSPYDEVPPVPTMKKRTPSPLVPQQFTGGPIHASPSTMASHSPGSKSQKNQHALLDSYSNATLSPQTRPVPAGPPTAIPGPDGYFSQFPLPQGPPPSRYRPVTTGVPSTAFPASTAFHDDDEYEDVDEDVPHGITIIKPGDPNVWVPFETPGPTHPPMPPPYGAPASPPEAYQKQAHRPRPRHNKAGRGLPITLHAPSTFVSSSPRTRAKQFTQSTATSEYPPSQYPASQIVQFGAAV